MSICASGGTRSYERGATGPRACRAARPPAAVLDELRPTKTLADSLGERREQLHWAWVDFFESHHRANGELAHSRKYLLVSGERR
jgi:hypothetical protein